jgi:hypothetical protein
MPSFATILAGLDVLPLDCSSTVPRHFKGFSRRFIVASTLAFLSISRASLELQALDLLGRSSHIL